MKKAILLSAIAVSALLVGCSPSQDAKTADGKRPEVQTAKCVFAHLDKEDLFNAGYASTNPLQGIELTTRLAFPCPGTWDVWASDDYRKAAQTVLNADVAYSRDFKAGQYASIAGAAAPAQVRTRLGEIALLLEDVYLTRRDLGKCEQVEPQALALVAQLDATFALAVIGRYAGYDDMNAAQGAAFAVAKRIEAAAPLVKPQACTPELKARLQGHVKQWEQFVHGDHPWAKGCRVEVEEDAFTLKCAPAGEKGAP